MEELTFYQRMNRGRHPEGAGLEGANTAFFTGRLRPRWAGSGFSATRTA